MRRSWLARTGRPHGEVALAGEQVPSRQSHKSCDADAALAGVLERWHSLEIPIPRLRYPTPPSVPPCHAWHWNACRQVRKQDPGPRQCDAWLTFRRGPGPNIVRWVYHLFLGLHGPLHPPWIRKSPPDRQLLGTSYLNGMWDLVASGPQGNKTACGFASPDPRPTTRRHSIGRFIILVYLPTYTPSGQEERERKRETREDRKIDQVAYFGIQKEGSTPTPLLGIEPEARPFALCVGS